VFIIYYLLLYKKLKKPIEIKYNAGTAHIFLNCSDLYYNLKNISSGE